MTDNSVANKVESLRALIELIDPKELETILEQSHGFADSQVMAAHASESKAWKVSAAFGAVSLALAGAIIVMMPLKTVVPPKVLLVDKELATVSEMQTLEEVRVSVQEAATRKAVNDFILARESYTKDTAELHYYTAAAFMSAPLQTQWAAYWDQSNENSPFKVYKGDVKIRPEILTITPTAAPGVATARVKRWMKRGDGEPVATVLNATVTYKYVNTPTEEKIRRINPFGFQVTDYKTDPELGGVVEKRAAAAAPAPAAPAVDASAGLVAPQITPETVRREAQ
jgi:type IV secretion system protein VirB8